MNEIIIGSLFLIPTLVLILSIFKSLSLKASYRSIQIVLYGAIAGGIGTMIWSSFNDHFNVNLIQVQDFALAFRFDTLSALIYTMIAIIGLVVVRYSRNYLDGEQKHKQFISRLALTIAFVQLVVISGNLATLFVAWVGTSIGLHKLLLIYPERKNAQLASRKKFIIARLGDLTLFTAFILIYNQFGTADMSRIFESLQSLPKDEFSSQLEIAGVLLVITACLKSVQIPFHGWLLEVMESPTPVSAILHAGLLNAGPFLILRFSSLIDLATSASTFLIIIGAASALFGVISASTQPSVKTSLAYSSIGHMGFTLFVCGLGVYPAALLHLVAHSFYKAHAFLSSGSLIEKIQTSGATHYKRKNQLGRMAIGLVTSGSLFLAVTLFWQRTFEVEFQLLVISAIIFLGILSLHINTLDSENRSRSVLRLIFASFIVINCFYLFEHTFATYLGSQVPNLRSLSDGTQLLIIGLLVLFALTVLSQSVFTQLNNTQIFRKLEIHFRNGLYLNHIMNRLMKSLITNPSK